MEFIQVDQFGGPEQLKLREEPAPAPAKGQVLIEVKACGVNFADLTARSGSYPMFPSAPFRPGFEVAGTVAGVGEGVPGFVVGQRVMALTQGGGYASHAVVDAAMTVPLPDSLDFAPATALLVQGLTAYFLLENGHLKPGGTVLVPSAAGGVGSLAVQIAKLKGAGKVIGLASPSKHQKVLDYGADDVFDYTQPGWSTLVRDATEGKGVDIFLDSQAIRAEKARIQWAGAGSGWCSGDRLKGAAPSARRRSSASSSAASRFAATGSTRTSAVLARPCPNLSAGLLAGS